MATVSIKPSDVRRKWYVVDAADKTLGRLASQIAHRLRGKHKPEYTPHVDVGDYIIVINARAIRVTGNKLDKNQGKQYYRHSQYPGGLKQKSLCKLLAEFPERVIEYAVKGMLPMDKPLGRDMFRKLKVYADEEHPHVAQQPEVLDIQC